MDKLMAQAWMTDFAALVERDEGYLTDLDRQVGDADHGTNMTRGMQAVAALDAGAFDDARAYLAKAAMTLVSTVGGASGPLYGTFLTRFASALPDGDADTEALVAAWRAGVEGVMARGKAGFGDKTMLDALIPAVEAMEDATGGTAERLAAGLDAACEGRDRSADRVARKGRASYLGDRSRGVVDPGAASSVLLVEAATRTLS